MKVVSKPYVIVKEIVRIDCSCQHCGEENKVKIIDNHDLYEYDFFEFCFSCFSCGAKNELSIDIDEFC